jgi:hypothetical protein
MAQWAAAGVRSGWSAWAVSVRDGVRQNAAGCGVALQ